MIKICFFLGLIFVKIVHGLLPPTDGKFESHDLDFNLTWSAPSDVIEVHTLRYTVYYAEHTSIYLDDSLWKEVSGCINLTSTNCKVTSVIDLFRDFSVKTVLRIKAIDETTGDTSQPLQVELFPDRNVHLSSPTINIGEVSQHLVTLRLSGPKSPYRDVGDTKTILRVEEVAPSLKDQIYYIVTLEGRDSREIKETTARYPYMEFSNLIPGSEYNILARTKFYGVFETTYSQHSSTQLVYTTLDAVLNKPLDVEVKDKEIIDCTHPDLRDVVVTWKRPVSHEYISFYDMNVWIAGHESRKMSFVIPSDINRTFYSFSLSSLPRWSRVDVIVFANTSFAGCASFKSALYPHAVDEERSQPENLSAVRTNSNTLVIIWRPPSSCPECIMGYEVFWELAINRGSMTNTRDTVANDVLRYEISQDGDDVTMVQVSTLLRSGTNMQKTGETAVFGIYQEEPEGILRTITVCLGVAILSMLTLVIYFYKSKSKKRRKEDPKILDISITPKYYSESNIFRQYSSSSSSGQPYSRSIYVREPEIFDELLPLKKTANNVNDNLPEKSQPETNPDSQDSGQCDPD